MAQVYSDMPARIYCCRIVDYYARHFEDIDRDVFTLFVVGQSCPRDDLGWVF